MLASLFNISFSFSFDLFFYFELRVRIRGDITIILLYINHIRWYSHDNGYKSWDYREECGRFWKDDIITIYLTYSL